MSKTSRIKINLKDQTFYNRPIKVQAIPRKVKLGLIYRVIADIPEFEIQSVGSVLVGGSLTVRWSTGVGASTTLEYSYNDPTIDQSVTISGTRKYHEVTFPQTFVDTDHFFRVVSTSPDGVTKTSQIYKVTVTDVLVIQSILGGHEVDFIGLNMLHHQFPDASDGNTFSSDIFLRYEPDAVAEAGLPQLNSMNQITVPNVVYTPTQTDQSLTTIITTTVT